jgi:hypothetical protein
MADYWPQIIPAVSVLVGALIGGIVSYKAQIAGKEADSRNARNSLSLAVAAEIEAYIDLMQNREHEKYAEALIAANQSGVQTIPKAWISGHELISDPLPVLRANLQSIGLLGADAGDKFLFHASPAYGRRSLPRKKVRTTVRLPRT